MKLGYAQADITPLKASKLSGYGAERVSVGIHDPLMVRVMVFNDNEVEACIVQTDLVGVDQAICDMLSTRLDLEKAKLFVCATHTHSGPTGTVDLAGLESIFGAYDHDYVEYWLSQTIACYKEAYASCVTTKVGYKQIALPGIGTDRHDGSYGDERVGVWYFVTDNDKKYLLYNLACHSTVLSGENLLITADLPAGVISAIDSKLDGIVFINGSAGDISTRYTRKDSSFEELSVKGKLIADALSKAIDDMKMVPLETIKTHRAEFPFAKLPAPDQNLIKAAMAKQLELIEEAKQAGAPALEIRTLSSVVEGYKSQLKIIPVLKQRKDLKLTVAYMMINDTILIGLPVELFAKLSHEYRLEDPRLHFVSYCNGYYIYLPSKQAYENNYYEAGTTIFAKGQGEILMEQIYQHLLDLKW